MHPDHRTFTVLRLEELSRKVQNGRVRVCLLWLSAANFIVSSSLLLPLQLSILIISLHVFCLSLFFLSRLASMPVLMLPNLVFKGCASTVILFIELQALETRTHGTATMAWLAFTAAACIYEMHYMLWSSFQMAQKLKEREILPPSYKQVKLEDGSLPSYEDAIRREVVSELRVDKLQRFSMSLADVEVPSNDCKTSPSSSRIPNGKSGNPLSTQH